jgi:hypothetical protein
MVCDSLGVEPDADTKEDAPGNSFVRRITTLGGLICEKVWGALHHGMKRTMAVVRSGFEYDMGLVADGFTSKSSKTEEENEAACLGLIEATEEPGGRLARLFEDEVLPPFDNEGLCAKFGHEGPCNELVFVHDSYCRGPRGLKIFRCKYVLNVFFCSRPSFLFRSNRVLTQSSWRAVAPLGVGCEWRYRSPEA